MPESRSTLHCGTLPVKLRLCSLELVARRKPVPNIRCTRFAVLKGDQACFPPAVESRHRRLGAFAARPSTQRWDILDTWNIFLHRAIA